MLLKDYLGKPSFKGDLGVEIEYCGDFTTHEGLDLTLWSTTDDASLGRGIELVSRAGVTADNLDTLLSSVPAFLANNLYVPSVRAGVHVHVNVLEMDFRQICTFITAYLGLEPALIKWCGEEREGNLFCLRATDAEYLIETLLQGIVSKQPEVHWETDDIRYASMNVNAIPKYGSIEFRAMRSTNDMEAIKTWALMLLHLRDRCKEVSNPKEIVEISSQLTFKEWADRLLGPYAFIVEGQESAVRRSIRYAAQDIAYAVDWFKHFAPAQKGKNPFIRAVDHERKTISV